MSVSDSIADALNSIKTGSRANKESVDIPSSKLLLQILEVFKKDRYIDNYRFVKDNKQGVARVYLKYDANKAPAISDLKRVSTPGLRVYADRRRIPRVLDGLGIAVISTSQGVVSDKDARQKKIGGEVLCYIW